MLLTWFPADPFPLCSCFWLLLLLLLLLFASSALHTRLAHRHTLRQRRCRSAVLCCCCCCCCYFGPRNILQPTLTLANFRTSIIWLGFQHYLCISFPLKSIQIKYYCTQHAHTYTRIDRCRSPSLHNIKRKEASPASWRRRLFYCIAHWVSCILHFAFSIPWTYYSAQTHTHICMCIYMQTNM